MSSLLGLIIVGIVVWIVISESRKTNQKRKAIADAQQAAWENLKTAEYAYEKHLERLKNEPNNPSLRQETLRLGRFYSNLTRSNQGVTVFDEVALLNDINAACAAAASPHRAKEGSGSQSIEERLEMLVLLRNRGLISMTEWAERRKEILKDV